MTVSDRTDESFESVSSMRCTKERKKEKGRRGGRGGERADGARRRESHPSFARVASSSKRHENIYIGRKEERKEERDG